MGDELGGDGDDIESASLASSPMVYGGVMKPLSVIPSADVTTRAASMGSSGLGYGLFCLIDICICIVV